MNRENIIGLLLLLALPITAQVDSFEKYKQQQGSKFDHYSADKQTEWNAYRKRVNEEYADFMRQKWAEFPVHEAEKPVPEKPVEPIVFDEPIPAPAPKPDIKPSPKPNENNKPLPSPKPAPTPAPKPDTKPSPKPNENNKPLPAPKPETDPKPVQIAIKPQVVVIPTPQPAPEPIAPIVPKEEPYKKVSVGYFGSIITIGFPTNDNLKLYALEENAIADAWKQLSDSRYDITVSSALNARNINRLCDWAYMKMLQAVTEKQYGKTNEAVLMQAFLMTQSGYRIRLGMNETKLYMLVASLYDIFGIRYYLLDGTKFYNVSGDKNVKMQITKANYDKEKSLSLQMTQLPQLGDEQTPRRTLTSKKGITASVSLNKNLIDFFNIYPKAYFGGDFTTHWAAYANTPLENNIKNKLYPQLKKVVDKLDKKEAVNMLLNWVQTAFVYKKDDDVWGNDRAFFAQETLYYPYCDCEDRSILFSRLVRDILGLEVVLLYYPGHLATAVAFNDNVSGDYVEYKGKRYVVCDPTYIGAPVGLTMPNMNNQQATIIVLNS